MDEVRTHAHRAFAAFGGYLVTLSEADARRELERAVAELRDYPGGKSGRGVVIAAGGEKYFTCAWVCVKLLRRHGCRLPVQFWHLGSDEAEPWMRRATDSLGVEWVDGREVARRHPARILNGWELKAYSILHSPFQEVLFLDADNVPVRDPNYLFDSPEYQRTGAVFWPDFGRLGRDRAIWRLTGIPYRDEPEFESGQILVDKARCFRELSLALWFNEHSDFWYRHFHGDKETFHLAWRKLGTAYAMPPRGIHHVGGHTMCQHDFAGARVFQHRNLDKWKLSGENRRDKDFLLEAECHAALAELRELRSGQRERTRVMEELGQSLWLYERAGHDERWLELLPSGLVGRGAAACEQTWSCDASGSQLTLRGDEPTCTLQRDSAGVFRGRWLRHERMPVALTPFRVLGAAERALLGELWQYDAYELATLACSRPRLAEFVVIGAGSGAVSLRIKRLWPAARVLSIEGDPDAFALLQQNLSFYPETWQEQALVGEGLSALLEARGFPAPDYLHLGLPRATAALLEQARGSGLLERVGIVGGEYSGVGARARIAEALGPTHEASFHTGAGRMGSFVAIPGRGKVGTAP